MRQRRSLLSHDDPTKDLWPSFTDITSTFALILFVLVLLAYVRNLLAAKQIDAYAAQIRASSAQLADLEGKIARANADLAAGRQRLSASEQQIDEQREVIASNSRELGELRGRLRSMAVLRVEVLQKVKTAMEAQLATRLDAGGGRALVAIGENGNLIVHEGLVFESNSYSLKKEGKSLLDGLAQAFERVLADPEVRSNIDVITIQGHTDERGTDLYNRELSAKRADAVLNHLFEANPSLGQSYGGYFAASAYSKFRPIDPGKDEAAYERNRRIEISVVLKDASLRSALDAYLGDAGVGEAGP